MKVSLVSPPSMVMNRYPEGHPLRKAKQITEPLGLGYLAAMIEDIADVQIVDCMVENLSTWDCVQRTFDNDIIGISTVTSNINISLNLAEQIKKHNPNSVIIFGGVHASLYPSKVLQQSNKAVDLIVIGEGEYTLRKIVEGQDYNKIDGLAYRENGKIKINPSAPLEKELDKFPFPARHLLPMEKYHPFLYLRSPIHSLISERGCPFTCTFCCRDISGQNYRVRRPEKVVEEVVELVNKWRSREVSFQDPIFGLNEKWSTTFCNLLIAEKLDVVWTALTRIDVVNEKLLKLYKKSGCWMLYYGIEGGTQQLLDNVRKRTTLEMVRKSIKLTSKIGIKTWGSFMFALPGETPKLARETLNFAKKLPLDFASFHLTTPFEGTELRKTYEKWGKLTFDDDEYTQLKPVFIPFGWKDREDQLTQFYHDAWGAFYFRFKYILRQLAKMRSLNELKMYYRGTKVI